MKKALRLSVIVISVFLCMAFLPRPVDASITDSKGYITVPEGTKEAGNSLNSAGQSETTAKPAVTRGNNSHQNVDSFDPGVTLAVALLGASIIVAVIIMMKK